MYVTILCLGRAILPATLAEGAAGDASDFNEVAANGGVGSIHLYPYMRHESRPPLKRDAVSSAKEVLSSPMFSVADEVRFLIWFIRRLFFSAYDNIHLKFSRLVTSSWMIAPLSCS